MKDLQKDLKMIISTNISETEKDEWIEKLVNGYIDQQKALIIYDVSQQRELFVSMFDKMTNNDIQECINGFAERVFDRISNQ